MLTLSFSQITLDIDQRDELTDGKLNILKLYVKHLYFIRLGMYKTQPNNNYIKTYQVSQE